MTTLYRHFDAGNYMLDDPDAEAPERPDRDYSKCATCGTERLTDVLDADNDCPKCVKKFHLVERFNETFGFTLPWKFTSLYALENYSRMMKRIDLAEDIRKHIDFYTPKPISAARTKPVDCLTVTVSPAGGGKI